MRLTSFLITLALVTGLSAQPAGQPAPIRVLSTEVDNINPLLITAEDQIPIVDLMFDRLVGMNAQGEFIPEILEHWELSPDKRQATLVVRPGLAWQDGHPLDAEDILFTWKLIRTPAMVKAGDNQGRWIPNMTKVGRLTLKVTSSAPMATLLAELYNFIPVPSHLYKPVTDPANHAFNWAPVGSGPYRVLPGATGKDVRLVRWEGYRGPYPGKAPAFVFKTVQGSYPKAMYAGEGDFLNYSSSWLPNYLLQKGVVGGGRLVAFNTVQDGFSALWMNCDPQRSVLADVRLRQALANLIPFDEYARQRIVRPIQVANSVWHPLSWAFDPTPKPLPKRELALQLLDQAGWTLGPKGWRQNARGQELILTFYLAGSLNQTPVVKRWVECLQEAGVRVDCQVVSTSGIFKMQYQGKGDIWMSGWVNNGPDPSGDRLLYSSEGIQSRTNWSSFRNAEVDRLFELGAQEVDLEARKGIYQRINQILFRERPLILLEYSPAYAMATKELKGVVFSGRGMNYGFIPGMRGWSLAPGGTQTMP
ncbi:MAG TPA: ABC transporter substrate-binding protein [Holophagaceae bacterium]|nr:ABC transporter substrate-binding protein [Holophagaceae bacterium]